MKSKTKKKNSAVLPILNPDAAGIDIGATEIYVAVPPGRDGEPVRSFQTFTADLRPLCQWLQMCQIRTVANGIHRGLLDTAATDSGDCRPGGVSGECTSRQECSGTQDRCSRLPVASYLHSVGLLKASFRPAQEICAIRSLLRHRDSLVSLASQHVLHMQKALDQTNLQLHHLISDITGVTGLAIIDAVIAGERDTTKLAALRNPRIRTTKEIIAKSLVGNYRSEHIFALQQSVRLFRVYQEQIVACDLEIERLISDVAPRADAALQPLPPAKDSVRKCKVIPPARAMTLREEGHRLLGVDLNAVPGISALTVQTIVAEVGPDLSKFRSAAAFSSWMGLSPNNESAEARSCVQGHGTLRIEQQWPCECPPSRFRRANRLWARSTAVCARD